MAAVALADRNSGVQDVEVSPRKERAKRRQFSAAYKQRILEEASRCTQPGELGAFLRREGLYSSHLTVWRAALRRGGRAALSQRRRQAERGARRAHAERRRTLANRRDHCGSLLSPLGGSARPNSCATFFEVRPGLPRARPALARVRAGASAARSASRMPLRAAWARGRRTISPPKPAVGGAACATRAHESACAHRARAGDRPRRVA